MRSFFAAAALLVSGAPPALAQEPPVPKMFQSMQGQKGQWQVEFLEGAPGKARPPTMTICTDNLLRRENAQKRERRESQCTHRLLKDTASEAVVESTCPDSTNVTTLTRESPKSLLMSMRSTHAKGERTTKMRYTSLGPCREGQGAMTLDPNSDQCRRMKERSARLDPEKSCARTKGDRAECEQRVRDTAKQLAAMCGS